MLSFDNIKRFYTPKEQLKKEWIIKEYLQHQILKIIYSSEFWKNLVFLWWTAIRIVYWTHRFSEDLYFDNFWLNEEDFEKLTSEIKKELELLWFEVEIKNVYKWAWHCNIRFLWILFDSWLSKFQEEKILIQIDSVSQDYIYPSIKKMINKCDVIQYINTCPTSILLSKKIYALLARKD